jgi:hypothetical protein
MRRGRSQRGRISEGRVGGVDAEGENQGGPCQRDGMTV